MHIFNFVAWLTAGAIVGWFARRMIEAEHSRVVIPVSVVGRGKSPSIYRLEQCITPLQRGKR
jgi:hypothetical protein